MLRNILPTIAILSLTAIAIINATFWKIDGALLTGLVSIIAGLGGYAWGTRNHHHA